MTCSKMVEEMDYGKKLQEGVVFVTLISTVCGGAYVFYTAFSQPNYVNGLFFENAWLEYGVGENTLYFEYPFGDLTDSIPAFAEVIKRTAAVLPVNFKLQGKPLVVVALTRPPGNTDLVEMVRFTICPEDIYIVGLPPHQSKEWRYAFFKQVWYRSAERKESFKMAKLNETTNEVTYVTVKMRKNSATFREMVEELNSTRMQRILDKI